MGAAFRFCYFEMCVLISLRNWECLSLQFFEAFKFLEAFEAFEFFVILKVFDMFEMSWVFEGNPLTPFCI